MKNESAKQKIKKENSIWKPFVKLMAKSKLPYGWIIFSIIVAYLSIQTSLIAPKYVQEIFKGNITKTSLTMTLVVGVVAALLLALSNLVSSVATAKINLKIRGAIWEKILKVPIPFFDENRSKELISRTVEDSTLLSTFLGANLAQIVKGTVGVVGALVIIGQYDYRLLLTQIIIPPCSIASSILIGRLSFKFKDEAQGNLAKLTEFLSEIIVNIPTVKIFSKEEKEIKRGNENIQKLFKANFKVGKYEEYCIFANGIVEAIQMILILVVARHLMAINAITPDVWIAFYMYNLTLLGSINQLRLAWMAMKICQGSAKRITEISEKAPEDYSSNSKVIDDKNDIIFKNVSFNYGDSEILKNLNFNIPYGKVTAIVGPSGAGKTTLITLIERFYKCRSGYIKYGDKVIDDFNVGEWRKTFAYVTQDAKMFSGTIRENLVYGIEKEITDVEIYKALKIAHALEFINTFEDGIETQVLEGGSKLSGGQRQRIAIARAILKDPQYLILDEATSNLDPEAEYLVEKAIKNLLVGRTAIVIAHRLSTIKDADQIIVLKSGEVNGIGNHNSLLKDNEIYKQLVESQFKVSCN